MAHFEVPPHVENEAAYIAATEARIAANRRKGGRKRWHAAFEDAPLLEEWLLGEGQFASGWQYDPECELVTDEDYGVIGVIHKWEHTNHTGKCNCRWVDHPLRFYATGDFLNKMRESLEQWGGLTEGQHRAVRKCYDRAVENLRSREERRTASIQADRDNSKFVGTVGERIDMTLLCEKQFYFEGTFGATYINLCRDPDNNVVVYKGSNAWTQGVTVKVKATIKAHETRDGIAQTIIARPKVL